MSIRQEGFADGLHQQDQVRGGEDTLVAVCEPRHHLKFHRCEGEDMTWKFMMAEDSLSDQGLKKIPWWISLDTSLNLV
jgi:hypothetical protein